MQKKFEGVEIIPKPDYWGGWIVNPLKMEFWFEIFILTYLIILIGKVDLIVYMIEFYLQEMILRNHGNKIVWLHRF